MLCFGWIIAIANETDWGIWNGRSAEASLNTQRCVCKSQCSPPSRLQHNSILLTQRYAVSVWCTCLYTRLPFHTDLSCTGERILYIIIIIIAHVHIDKVDERFYLRFPWPDVALPRGLFYINNVLSVASKSKTERFSDGFSVLFSARLILLSI